MHRPFTHSPFPTPALPGEYPLITALVRTKVSVRPFVWRARA